MDPVPVRSHDRVLGVLQSQVLRGVGVFFQWIDGVCAGREAAQNEE